MVEATPWVCRGAPQSPRGRWRSPLLAAGLAALLASGCGQKTPSKTQVQEFNTAQLQFSLQQFEQELSQSRQVPMNADDVEKFVLEVSYATKGTNKEADGDKLVAVCFELQNMLRTKRPTKDQVKQKLVELREAMKPFES